MCKKIFAGGLQSSHLSLDQRYTNVTRNHRSHWAHSREPPPKALSLHHQEATDVGSQLLVWLVGLLLAYGFFQLRDWILSLRGICWEFASNSAHFP